MRPPAVELELRVNQTSCEDECLFPIVVGRGSPGSGIQMSFMVGIAVRNVGVTVRVHFARAVFFYERESHRNPFFLGTKYDEHFVRRTGFAHSVVSGYIVPILVCEYYRVVLVTCDVGSQYLV